MTNYNQTKLADFTKKNNKYILQYITKT